ncbi:MAG: LytTR family transcriptional regulator [Alphaproteobacteria bacterium]|nr:LytTR family transcriptional regulator [Alphaproteobacteria bacterium]
MTGLRLRSDAAAPRGGLALDRDGWLRLALFLGVPLFIGFLLGWLRAGATVSMSRPEAIGFILSSTVPAWLCYAVATALLARLTARWPSPLLVKLAVGGVVGSLLSAPVLALRRALLDLPGLPTQGDLLTTVSLLLQYNLTGILTWIVAGLMFHHLVGLPLFGHAAATTVLPAAPGAPTAGVAGVQGRLPAHIRGPIRLLAASEHYLRVVTDRGEAMVLYRFGDAVAEQPLASGAQVHRSWWIAREAVAAVRRSGAKVTIELHDGTEVPVSRTYLMDAKRAGLV